MDTQKHLMQFVNLIRSCTVDPLFLFGFQMCVNGVHCFVTHDSGVAIVLLILVKTTIALLLGYLRLDLFLFHVCQN